MTELRIMQKQMVDAFARGWYCWAETLRRQIISYIANLMNDPADPVILRTDERQEEEMQYERDYLEKN